MEDIKPVAIPSAKLQVLAVCPTAQMHIEKSYLGILTYQVMVNGRPMGACSFSEDQVWYYALEKLRAMVEKQEVNAQILEQVESEAHDE